mmetsp:Transcript_46378/g.46839  ORF Transcript_46378/g.46839 Transcript_46378/m.46839 type:complete len:87 (-) Transcript_46378:7-267(-)
MITPVLARDNLSSELLLLSRFVLTSNRRLFPFSTSVSEVFGFIMIVLELIAKVEKIDAFMKKKRRVRQRLSKNILDCKLETVQDVG